jgi:hypothetical protein
VKLNQTAGVALLFLVAAAAPAQESYLQRTCAALDAAGAQMSVFSTTADTAAAALAAGGHFWVAGHPALISEFSGRAGGLMALKPLRLDDLNAGDVVLYAPGGTPDDAAIASARTRGARVVGIGGAGDATLPAFGAENLSPTLAGALTGWTWLAELIAALTRQGKMPVIYESIGTYNGYRRIAEFDAKGIHWHESHQVPPIPPGALGPAYVTAVRGFLERVERELRPQLDRAGRWAAEARAGGHRTVMYNMGHLFPHEVAGTDIGTFFESATWNAGFMSTPVPEDTYQPGDLIVHIGYQHPPYRLLPRTHDAGARTVYVSVLQHRDYPTSDDTIWIDPMWPWADGVVIIPNYDAPACPPSGVVNAAIAWEIYRLATSAN